MKTTGGPAGLPVSTTCSGTPQPPVIVWRFMSIPSGRNSGRWIAMISRQWRGAIVRLLTASRHRREPAVPAEAGAGVILRNGPCGHGGVAARASRPRERWPPARCLRAADSLEGGAHVENFVSLRGDFRGSHEAPRTDHRMQLLDLPPLWRALGLLPEELDEDCGARGGPRGICARRGSALRPLPQVRLCGVVQAHRI